MSDGGSPGPDRPTSTDGCPVCSRPLERGLFESRDYLTGETFAVRGCTACGTARTVFPYPEASLDRYYGGTYYGESGQRFPRPLEKLVSWFRQGRVRRILEVHPDEGRVVDVGCGRGLILKALHRVGWDCYGTELSPELVAGLAAGGISAHGGALADWGLPEGTFDVAVLWHSLEHQAEPSKVLDEVVRLLKPGGVLFVEVPNGGSLQARLGGEAWFHLDVPRHLVHFRREGLVRLLDQRGMVVESQSTWSLEQGPFGMVQSLLNRWTSYPNVLYSGIKGRRGPLADVAITAVLLAPVALAGFALEGAAAACGRGGVLSIMARRSS